jgi:CHAT domain-containing protein
MKALQAKKNLAFSLGILLISLSTLENIPTATAQQSSPDPVQPSTAPALPTVVKPVGLDVAAMERSLEEGDIAGGIQEIELGWKRQYEDYYQGKLTSRMLNVDQIAQVLAKNYRKTGQKSALIYVVPTSNHLELVLIAPEGPPVHRRVTEATRPVLMSMVKTLRNEVANSAATGTTYLPAAQSLYKWIIAPLEPELEARHINALIFCLGGGLRSLPVAALHDGQQFLVEKYGLSIIPAFNLLDKRASKLRNIQVLAMGASEFKDNSARLPGVPLELSTVIGNPLKGEQWLNQDFTLANLKARRENHPFEIVHLATHAQFAPGDVSQSYLQFWDDRLSLDHFKEMGLRSPKVQLLVLSACQTALGDTKAELGFAGVAVKSGSKAALASLWAVSDAGTLRLMSEFYRQLPTAPTKVEALRQAQIAMIKGTLPQSAVSLSPNLDPFLHDDAKDVDYKHPYYWSAFTLVGNSW